METLKTAAIVVLLMTVTYSAYVSLTTPPEPLTTDIPELVFNDDSQLAFNSDLPDSLDELGISAGAVSESIEANEQSPISAAAGPDARLAMANMQDNVRAGMDFSSDDAPPLTVPFAEESLPLSADESQTSLNDAAENAPSEFDPSYKDLPPPAVPATEMTSVESVIEESTDGVSMQLSDDVVSPGVVPAEQTAPTGRYPRTSTTFQMPDPNDFSSADLPRSTQDPAAQSPDAALALTSGTSDAASAEDVPPYNEVAQTNGIGDSNSSGSPNIGLANAIRTADGQYASGQRKEALATLSIFYNTPSLSGEERAELLTRLDPLAREVIYSKRHLLEQPHRVGANETLVEIAERFEVPWQLLANINQVTDPVTILPGTELKVVRGPFRAEVSLSQKEMTLFLGDLYAGRFPIELGNDPRPRPGTFTVQDKRTARTYYDTTGSPVPAGSPNNPYGNMWLDLGGQLSIHGSPSTTEPSRKGCISLASDYAEDLYGILSQGSAVRIRR